MRARHTNTISLLILSVCLLTSAHLAADSVYKSIDEDGKVTYTSTPSANNSDVVKVKLLPPPSEKEIKQAQQRHQQNLRTDKILDENRQRRSQELSDKNRIKREKKELAEINQKPEETKEEGPYYGIPGHGILVLPKGPRINR